MVISFFVGLMLVGCTPLATVKPEPHSIHNSLEPGDRVYVLMKNDKEHKWFTVNELGEHSITLDYREYDYNSIQEIGKYDESADSTYPLIVITTLLVALPPYIF